MNDSAKLQESGEFMTGQSSVTYFKWPSGWQSQIANLRSISDMHVMTYLLQ